MNPFLLEISAWPWLERLSVREGRHVTLDTVPPSEWDRIAARGFNLLFLMGVWSRSAIGRDLARTDPSLVQEYDRILPGWSMDDVVGSPYCIERYEPDARMGSRAGLIAARRELNARGTGLILDFVTNHTGFDHPWIAQHPQRYVLGEAADVEESPADFRLVESVQGRVHVACGRDPHFPPWRDVAQLNYFNPETRQAMRGVLRALCEYCDGVRCDMAMLALNDVFERTWRRVLRGEWPRPSQEFWPGATRAVPDLLYLAEVYWDLEGVLLDQGFTFAYDKRLLDALQAPASAARVRQLLAANTPEGTRLARFVENHDEPRSAHVFSGRVTAAAALVATLPGMRFFFDGQEEGRAIRSPVQLGRWPAEHVDHRVRDTYERILAFASRGLLRDGEWRLLDVLPAWDDSHAGLVAYLWRTSTALAVIVVNPGSAAAQGHLRIADDLPDGAAFDFHDAVTRIAYPRLREPLLQRGLFVRLDAGEGHLFDVRVRASPASPQT